MLVIQVPHAIGRFLQRINVGQSELTTLKCMVTAFVVIPEEFVDVPWDYSVFFGDGGVGWGGSDVFPISCSPPLPSSLPPLFPYRKSLYCILHREWVPLSQLFLMSKAHHTPIKHRRYIAKVIMLKYVSRWGLHIAGMHTGHTQLTERVTEAFSVL